MEQEGIRAIEKQLSAARQKLLDLTMRNRLLNSRPTKGRTIEVIDEVPREIYDLLVVQERAMQFRQSPDAPAEKAAQAEDPAGPVAPAANVEAADVDSERAADDGLAARHTDKYLQTSLARDELQAMLFRIANESYSVLEEQGYTVLYIALGFLYWTEAQDPSVVRRAPLLLVPVELGRTKVHAAFRVQWTGEDIGTNLSLQEKLRDQGVALPDFQMPEDREDIDPYYEAVKGAIAAFPSWHVSSEIYLGFFSFTKFVMYKDLDPNCWPEGMTPASRPLIRALFLPGEADTGVPAFNMDAIDEKVRWRDTYYVRDADPSQIAVIEDVKARRNLVVEGPPGTGKSQTIANTIAELLAAGRTVLFVSEKMAALEVVKKRLDDAGLGDFCLELHSRKSRKKDVYAELYRRLRPSDDRCPGSLTELRFDEHESLIATLDGYAAALREPFREFGDSPFQLFERIERALRHFRVSGRSLPRLHDLRLPGNLSKGTWHSVLSTLEQYLDASQLISPVSANPWHDCAPGLVLPSDEAELALQIACALEAVSRMQSLIERLSEVAGACSADTFDEIPKIQAAAKAMASAPAVETSILLDTLWDRCGERANALLATLRESTKRREEALRIFKPGTLSEDVPGLETEYLRLANLSLHFLRPSFWRLRNRTARLYALRQSVFHRGMHEELQQLLESVRLLRATAAAEREGEALFGRHWQGIDSDLELLRRLVTWIPEFRTHIGDGSLLRSAATLAERGTDGSSILATGETLARAAEEARTAIQRIFDRLGVDEQAVLGGELRAAPFSSLAEQLETWDASLSRLQMWGEYVQLRERLQATFATPVVTLVEGGVILREDVVPCLEANLAESLLQQAFSDRPDLANFVGTLHQKKIERFQAIERQMIDLNKTRLSARLRVVWPPLSEGAPPGSAVGILRREANKTRSQMPLRKLMTEAGGPVQNLKPCFMMSPLSIAQFLDPRTTRFDVIIFDEASQVRPADALGALLRGSQLIVMGDRHQLPPTSFFDHLVEEDEGDEEATATVGVDSILELCSPVFLCKQLLWHYRSEHESLIAVSNQEFYENSLRVYPSPAKVSDELGLKFVHLPNTVYDRGGSATNREEARAVARAVIEHAQRAPGSSLGVGAFSIKQQHVIEHEIELCRKEHPELESFFSRDGLEPFFVKNLETIQGDERNVIFLSIGYGKGADEQLKRNFGPLTKDGGERRLNVLITRARTQCVVFSNFRAAEIQLEPTSSAGLRALKVFLEYAENGRLTMPKAPLEDTKSAFEEAVESFLIAAGYVVRRQVGSAGFRIDLAVVDPALPGRYLLGIECDGAKYHSSRVARDRDRLRQQALERLGWRIQRVWSADWYRRRREVQAGLVAAIKEAQAGAHGPSPKSSAKTIAEPGNPTQGTASTSKPAQQNLNGTQVPRSPARGVDYVNCARLSVVTSQPIPDCPRSKLAEAVRDVVEVEGPVHVDEVVRRIRTLWGFKRSGHIIREAICRGVRFAEEQGLVMRKDDFLWPARDGSVKPRFRADDALLDVEFICDEEIVETLKAVLERQFASYPEALINPAARFLGFQATSELVAARIRAVLQHMTEEGVLKTQPNGMLDLNRDTLRPGAPRRPEALPLAPCPVAGSQCPVDELTW